MTQPNDEYAVRTWTALGTYVFVAVRGSHQVEQAQRRAAAILGEVDRTCSRFRADSDLVRANLAPGQWTRVDPLLAAAVSVALEAARVTDGLVDPCLGRTMVALGYDADLGALQARPVGPAWRLPTPQPDAWREVRVAEDAVLVPDGVALDLGATAKAWAADLVAASVADELGCPVLVSLGGDLRIDGPPTDEPWPVRVAERPDETGELVMLERGGLATSSTQVRRWETTAGPMHHLVDPRTARPARSAVRTVSATGETCVAANTATTAALVLGQEAGAWLEERSVTARLVSSDGSVTRTGRWPAPTGAPA